MLDGGHNPDFLCPPPVGPLATFEEEIAGVRAVDPEVARADMALALAENRPGASGSAVGGGCLPTPPGPYSCWPGCWSRPGGC
ncbi:ArsR family transcriptional regulator OS=Streptomyces microflavus OX=1919 GN=Smic_57770 PE=4 SV=1 [Streptomyces microflavus]